jgi:hypothetical protein
VIMMGIQSIGPMAIRSGSNGPIPLVNRSAPISAVKSNGPMAFVNRSDGIVQAYEVIMTY